MTEPVGLLPEAGVTVAVKLRGCPYTAGLAVLVTVVVVAVAGAPPITPVSLLWE